MKINMNMKKIVVMVADNNAETIEGIRSLVSSLDDIQLLAGSPDFQKTLDAVKSTSPDILLLAYDLGNVLNWKYMLKTLMSECPSVLVIMLGTMGDPVSLVVEAMKAGAADVLTKPFKKEEVDRAILTAVQVKREQMMAALTPNGSRIIVAQSGDAETLLVAAVLQESDQLKGRLHNDTVDTAVTGFELLRACKQGLPPDLIILSPLIPFLGSSDDAKDLISVIRALFPETQVRLYTFSPSTDTAAKYGAEALLPKSPLEDGTLIAQIVAILDGTEQ